MGKVSWSPISSEAANILPMDARHGSVNPEDIGDEPKQVATGPKVIDQVFISKSDSDWAYDNCPGRDHVNEELFGNAHGLKDTDE